MLRISICLQHRNAKKEKVQLVLGWLLSMCPIVLACLNGTRLCGRGDGTSQHTSWLIYIGIRPPISRWFVWIKYLQRNLMLHDLHYSATNGEGR